MTCQERIDDSLQSRLDDIRLLWAGYTGADCEKCEGTGEHQIAAVIPLWVECPACEGTGTTPEDVPDLGNLNEYGLCFNYVEREDQEEGFFQYQLSYGGPSDEFRFFVGIDRKPYRIEYWFLDWFDGAHKILQGPALELLTNALDCFNIESMEIA